MNNIVSIRKLKKTYDNYSYVIDNFSYDFKDRGFYVFYGDSGSGKTTLLNIICGLTSFNDGTIYFNNKKYSNCVSLKDTNNHIAYITQENYFVDYLTIMDNILLCSNNYLEIEDLIKKFYLTNVCNKYPTQLSSGEKQRLSLVQALLKKKSIIILDEPTSHLDKENKKLVLDLINEMKKNRLIICSSHDIDVLNCADNKIDFNNLRNYNNEKKITTSVSLENNNNFIRDNIYKYVKKSNNYSNKNKKINLFLMIIFLMSILISFFCYDLNNKLLKTIQDKYYLNYLTVYCPVNNNSCYNIFNSKHVKEVAFVYGLNIPLNDNEDEGFAGNIEFSTDLITLPSSEKDFPFSNNLIYGHYFNNDKEIILGYNKALEYGYDQIEQLIDTHIDIKLPDGVFSFKIVGIFNEFSNEQKQYFKLGQNQIEVIDNKYFINGNFTKRYENDDIIGYNEKNVNKKVYYVYFDNFNHLLKNYNTLVDNKINKNNIYINSFSGQYLDIVEQFKLFTAFMYPVLIISILISLVFYYQLIKLDICYNKHIFSVYQYYGYSLNKIKVALLKSNLVNIINIFIASFVIAIIISITTNYVNQLFKITEYQIFTINISGVVIIFTLLIIISLIMSFVLYKDIRDKGWYALLKESDDLL